MTTIKDISSVWIGKNINYGKLQVPVKLKGDRVISPTLRA